jgi:hypothetical protein
MFRKILSLAFLLTLASCSIAPLSGPQSAKTLGDGNWQIDSGFTYLPYIAASRGTGENIDLGFTVETQMFAVGALNAKVAVYNEGEEGFATAIAGSLFHALDGDSQSKGFYVGPVFSYKASWFEPYLVVRYNWANLKTREFDRDDRDDFIFDLLRYGNNIKLEYMQYTLGFNFWTSDSFAFALDAKVLHVLSDHVKDDDRFVVLPGLNFIWKL